MSDWLRETKEEMRKRGERVQQSGIPGWVVGVLVSMYALTKNEAGRDALSYALFVLLDLERERGGRGVEFGMDWLWRDSRSVVLDGEF